MITRDESQQRFVDKWIAKSYKGGLAAVTSYGKTRTSFKCALQSKAKSTIVIVPTKDLKSQWEIGLKEWKVPNAEVYIVNTAAKMKLDTDLIIIDEAHTAGMADWFQLSWQNASFKKMLWLSATPERKDDKHMKLFSMAPKLMSVTFKEALENGWVSNYNMYNVSLEFTPEEKDEYDGVENLLRVLYKRIFDEGNFVNEEFVQRKAFDIARRYISSGDYKKINLGKEYYKLIGRRRQLLYNSENKLNRTIAYIKKNPTKKVLVFSQSREFADSLQDALGDICVTIHSGLKDKDREYNLKRFRDGRTKVRVISSVKALNEGVDIPQLDVGICAAGTSSKKDMVQMLGRVLRLYKDKHALFFNLYIRNTQDLYWLRNRQDDMDTSKIKWTK